MPRFNGQMEKMVAEAEEELARDGLHRNMDIGDRDRLRAFVMAGWTNMQLREVLELAEKSLHLHEKHDERLSKMEEFVEGRREAYEQPALPRRALNWADENPKVGYPALLGAAVTPPVGLAGIIYLLVEYVARGG